MDEKRILESLKKEDRSAFRELFDAYYDALILFANHLLNNAEAAEDVVQDCFVDFWISRRFEHLDGGIGKYLFQTCRTERPPRLSPEGKTSCFPTTGNK